MKPLILLLIFAFSLAGAQTKDNLLAPIRGYISIDTLSFPKTPTLVLGGDGKTLTFRSADGREAKLILTDSAKYVGDLPATDAAKILFWAIEQVYRESYSKQIDAFVKQQTKLATIPRKNAKRKQIQKAGDLESERKLDKTTQRIVDIYTYWHIDKA